jgi:hypothetical protein
MEGVMLKKGYPKKVVGLCEDCKWRDETKSAGRYLDAKGYAGCKNSKFLYGYEKEDLEKLGLDGFQYVDGEYWSASFAVGPKFGCIHFEEKE